MLVIVAVAAIAVFEIWFFFFSGSPIDQRSGRGEVPAYVVSAGTHQSGEFQVETRRLQP